MLKNESFIEKLERQIDELYPVIETLLNNSSVYHQDYGDVIVLASPYHWGKKDKRTQIIAKQHYLSFLENLELLIDKANPDILRKLKKTEKKILELIEQSRAPSSIEGGKQGFKNDVKVFKEFLNLLKKDETTVFVIPDTNAMIQYPEPASYRKLIASPFSFVVLPTILSELDKLKINHRSEDLKNKAKSVIKRLKGYRQQGNVLEGVTVDKTITVKMVATEPKFDKTLKWLDPLNEDDRIIANALEIQIQNPSDRVILVTSDINLQNKAQLANLTFADTDDLE